MLACIVDSVFEQLQSLLLVNVGYELMQVHFHRSADVSNAKALLRALNIYILHLSLIPYSLIQKKPLHKINMYSITGLDKGYYSKNIFLLIQIKPK